MRCRVTKQEPWDCFSSEDSPDRRVIGFDIIFVKVHHRMFREFHDSLHSFRKYEALENVGIAQMVYELTAIRNVRNVRNLASRIDDVPANTQASEDSFSPSSLRVFRLLRLLRALRVVYQFRTLYMLAKGFLNSAMTIVAVFGMATFFVFVHPAPLLQPSRFQKARNIAFVRLYSVELFVESDTDQMFADRRQSCRSEFSLW